LGSVIDYSTTPPRSHAFIDVPSIVMKISVYPPTITISPSTEVTSAELEKWNAEQDEKQYQEKLEHQRTFFEPAFFNPDAETVIELLSIENPDGQDLYKIYELVKGDKTKNNFQQEFEISNDSIIRFSDTVHKASVSGAWARHAKHEKRKSDNPMSKSEAKEFVHGIAKKWLKSIRQGFSIS
jgi:hypothetical protein